MLFVLFQTGSRSNGGLESISQVLERYPGRSTVVTQLETPFTERWRRCGCDVRVWSSAVSRSAWWPRGLRLLDAVTFNARLLRLLGGTDVEVVHCNDRLALWHAAPVARLAGKPVVLNLRDTQPLGAQYDWRWRLARHWVDELLVLSREMAQVIDASVRPLQGLGRLGWAPIEYIYSIVDAVRFVPIDDEDERTRLRRRLGIEKHELCVLYPATFNEKKAQLPLLRAFAARRAALPEALVLHFVGDFEPERNAYARACQEVVTQESLGDRVRFHGHQSGVDQWYQAADVVCLATRREGLARAMIESLACGTPVVSFNVCSAHEFLDRTEIGAVVPQGDYEGLFREATVLAKRGLAERRQAGLRAATEARKVFAPDVVVEGYRALYERLARGGC